MTRWLWVFVAASMLAGCLPIELSVSPGGEVLIARQEGFLAYDPKTGEVKNLYRPAGSPALGVYLPEGKGAFLAASVTHEDSRPKTDIALIDAGGRVQHLLSSKQVCYLASGPAGERFSFTAMRETEIAGVRHDMPTLFTMKYGDTKPRRLASDVSMLHRWSPDGRWIYAFMADDLYDDEDDDLYKGHLVRIDAADGEVHKVASVLGTKGCFLDLSPDGNTLVYTAIVSGKAGESLERPEQDRGFNAGMLKWIGGMRPLRPAYLMAQLVLYRADLKTNEIKALKDDVRYAFFCPEGKRLLVGSGQDGERLLLDTHDAGTFNHLKRIASDAALDTGEMPYVTDIYPGWLDNQTVMYLARVSVYGASGTNLNLITVPVEGEKRQNHQPAIDRATFK